MRPPRVGVLDRYFVRELVAPFALGCCLFTFFLVIDRIYNLTDLVITKGVPFHLVVQLLAFMLPAFLAHTLPMALLVAVLLAGGRMAGDMEIVAFKAAGLSVVRLFRPILIAGVAVALATGALTLWVNPLANAEFQRQLYKILQTRAASGLKERVFNTTFGDVVIYVEEVSASQVGLKGLLVSDERNPRLSRIVIAREGRLLTDEATQRITLRLINGGVSEADVTPADPPPVPGSDRTPVTSGAAGPRRYRYTAFSLYDMTLSVESPLRTLARLEKPERDLPTGDLRAKIHELRGDPYSRRPFQAELEKRFAFPVAALVFALVGFPLSVHSHRGGRSIALIGTLVILVSYYLLLTSLESMAISGHLPVSLAIWAPNLLFAAFGTALLLVTAREWRPPAMTVAWRILSFVWESLPRRRPRREERFTTTGRESTHVIDRYLLRQYLTFLGVALAVAAALFVIVDLLQTLDRYLRIKPPLLYIAEHFLYQLPIGLYAGLPIVMLVGTVFLYLTLSRYHELTALKAAGISLYRVSAPVLLLAIVVAVGAAIFQETVLPALQERGEEVDKVKIRGQPPRHLRARTRLWLRSADTRFYRVELLSPGTDELYGVTILETDGEFHLVNRLDARSARWSEGGWALSEGAFREIGPRGQVTTIPFERVAFQLPERITEFTDIQKQPEAMSYRELREYIAHLEAAGFSVKKYLGDLYAKLASPLTSFIMVLVAIPFALQSPRSGRVFGIGLAIAIMAGYMVVDYSARAFARADLLPPLLAAWTANVIFLGIGSSLFLRART
ncbi:MAG: LPS export ABC transporter permease LptG [Candidatus Rokubacteria bacterium]|nr:LPS export ABC transporter permease LptG [Candidatus Rokubacteria bacterium]MBI3825846.1 LPS export ABC transporter permease LptG [Candidatus Rokubacteria bacterium]